MDLGQNQLENFTEKLYRKLENLIKTKTKEDAHYRREISQTKLRAKLIDIVQVKGNYSGADSPSSCCSCCS